MTDLHNWTARPYPLRTTLAGRHVRLEPLDAVRHGDDLFTAATEGDADARFRWLPETPPRSRGDFQGWLDRAQASEDPQFSAVIDQRTGRAVGRQTLMRIDPANGVIETGNIHWGPAMQRSPLSTEALYLHARHVFDDLGYRRFEWKCNDENAPSKAAALRFGFVFEGVFRQHMIVKGRNRDTAWFSMIDREWPVLRKAFEDWLSPANFHADGTQVTPLGVFNARSIEAGRFTLARASPADRPAIEAFQREAYARTRDAIGSEPLPLTWDYAALLAECECWTAADGEGLSGVLILRMGDGETTLESIGTAPRMAGSGLGAALMDTAFARTEALGRRRIGLITNARNPAVDWYRRRGFRLESEEVTPGRTIVHMAAGVPASHTRPI